MVLKLNGKKNKTKLRNTVLLNKAFADLCEGIQSIFTVDFLML